MSYGVETAVVIWLQKNKRVIETPGGWNATTNIKSVFGVFNTVPKKAQEEVSKSLRKVASTILGQAKRNAPVKTGALRRSGRLQVVPGVGKHFVKLLITFGGPGTGVNYAQHVEFGSAKQRPRFYLLRAVRQHSPLLKPFGLKAFESVWDNEVRISNLKKLV